MSNSCDQRTRRANEASMYITVPTAVGGPARTVSNCNALLYLKKFKNCFLQISHADSQRVHLTKGSVYRNLTKGSPFHNALLYIKKNKCFLQISHADPQSSPFRNLTTGSLCRNVHFTEFSHRVHLTKISQRVHHSEMSQRVHYRNFTKDSLYRNCWEGGGGGVYNEAAFVRSRLDLERSPFVKVVPL